jgi:hypothetical protein
MEFDIRTWHNTASGQEGNRMLRFILFSNGVLQR